MGEEDGCYRFAFGVSGTRGDFQPYLSLAQNLVKRGHRVKLYSAENHCKDAQLFGIEAETCSSDMEDLLRGKKAMNAMEKGDFALIAAKSEEDEEEEKEPELINGDTVEEARRKAKESFLTFKPHLYLHNSIGHLPELDETLARGDIVRVSVPLQPQGLASNSFKSLVWAREFPEPDMPNICTHVWIAQNSARQMHRQLQSLVYSNQIDEENFHNFPGPEKIFRENFEQEKRPSVTILAYSPSVFPPPPDWPDVTSKSSRMRIVGRLQFSREQQGELMKSGNSFFSGASGAFKDCEEFLSKGPAPVYIGWGSMKVYGSAHMTYLAVEALMRADQRGIILSGWGQLSADDLQEARPSETLGSITKFTQEEVQAYAKEKVLFMKKAPHEWLFPQCCCCVHHGGIGTMQASLGAGTPTIITPVFADQASNAEFLTEGGWGLGTSHLGKLRPKELGEAISKVCTEPAFRERTQELFRKMEKEDGITEATEILERLVKEEQLTGKYKERFEADKAECAKIHTEQMKLPTETVIAKWNGRLNKRFPSWMEYNRRSMLFTTQCKEIVDDGRLWCVMASSCLVRAGQDLKSAEAGRFKRNCFLEQVEKKGSRLRVKKLKGFGPEEGWVSPTTSGKDILENVTDMVRLAAIMNEMYTKLFEDIVQG